MKYRWKKFDLDKDWDHIQPGTILYVEMMGLNCLVMSQRKYKHNLFSYIVAKEVGKSTVIDFWVRTYQVKYIMVENDNN